MGVSSFVVTFLCIGLWAGLILAAPSFDHGLVDNGVFLSFGHVLSPRSDHLEIRGVYGGRKKRYIIEREDSHRCCRDKICLTAFGDFLDKKCKCSKCTAPKVPSLDGKSCQDNCPAGQEKNDKGGCCPIGQRPKASGDGCEDNRNDNRPRKGKCKDDTVVDPREGYLDPDKVENPKCVIDDSNVCKDGKIPATRPEESANDRSYKVECGDRDPEPEKRAQCAWKNEYQYVFIDSEGKAKDDCKQTRRYRDSKLKDRPHKLRSKLKDLWNDLKPKRDKQNEERKANIQKLKELREKLDAEMKERDKLKGEHDRKKTRTGKCAPVAALMIGVAENINYKRDGESEHPYDWTSDYFDEDFMGSDDRLEGWPVDLNINDIGFAGDVGVDAEAWLAHWEELASAHDLDTNWRSCGDYDKRSVGRRCQKRSLDDPYLDADLAAKSVQNTSTIQRDFSLSHHTQLSPRDPKHLEKRFIQIFVEIAAFAARLATSLVVRGASAIARYSPRLASLAKNTDRLFKIAPKGQGGAKNGADRMKNAFQRIIKSDSFKQCLRDGIP